MRTFKLTPLSVFRATLYLFGICCLSYAAGAAFRNGMSSSADIYAGVLTGIAYAAVAGCATILPSAIARCAGAKAYWDAGILLLGWGLAMSFVIANAAGFSAHNRAETVETRAGAIDAYTRAVEAKQASAAKLEVYKANPRYTATSGCADATAPRSKDFCDAVKAEEASIQAADATLNRGKPGAVDAEAALLAWVLLADERTVSKAMPLFRAVVLEIVAALCFFAASRPALAGDVRTIALTPERPPVLPLAEVTVPAETPLIRTAAAPPMIGFDGTPVKMPSKRRSRKPALH